LKNLILAALAGLFYALAFPTYDLWPFACLFGLPLFAAIKDVDWREAFLYGLLAGIVAWGGLIYWLGYVVNIYGYLNLGLSALILLFFILYLALYMGLFAALAAKLLPSRFAILSVPGIWVLLELVRSYALTGFPWALLGYSLYPLKPLIQVAEFGGVYLISGIVMMANLAVYRLSRKDFKPLVLTLAVITACWVWGGWRMQSVPLQGKPLRVGIAQANIPQDQKWLEDNVDATVAIYQRLTDQAEVLEDQHLRAVADGDTGGFLTSVLERIEPVVGELGDVLTGGPDTENAALLARLVLRFVDRCTRCAGVRRGRQQISAGYGLLGHRRTPWGWAGLLIGRHARVTMDDHWTIQRDIGLGDPHESTGR
jgi:apolipoprotein N-acyltransferase